MTSRGVHVDSTRPTSTSGLSKAMASETFRAGLVITAIWVVMTWMANPWGDYPIIDDWVYAAAVKSVLRDGYYQMPIPASANVGPQIYWGALFCLPFGFSYDALRLSTSVLGWWGGMAMYRLVRQLGASAGYALLASLALIVNPMYFGLSQSFMTDVPFTVMSLVAIGYFVRYLETPSRFDLVAGIAAVLTTIMIRQLGVAILVGFAVAFVHRHGANLRNVSKVAALLAAGVMLHAVYQYWMVHSGRTPAFALHSDPKNFLPSPYSAWILRTTAFEMISYGGFLTLPVSILHGARTQRLDSSILRKAALATLVLMASILSVMVVTRDRGLPSDVPGSVLTLSGFGPVMLKDTFDLHLNEPVIPAALKAAWMLLSLASIASAALCVKVIGIDGWPFGAGQEGRGRSAARILCMVAVGTYGFIMLYASARFGIYDRYFLFLSPLLMVALFLSRSVPTASHERSRIAVSAAAVSCLAIMAVAATHDFAELTRLRWEAVSRLVAVDKVGADRIDGGMEFNGSMLYRPDYVRTKTRSNWWVEDDEYLIASGPVPGYVEIRHYDFQRWFVQQPGRIVVLRRSASR